MRRLVLLSGWLFTIQVLAAATDIANMPVEAQNASKPNIIFGLDDSGSMDFEVLLNTNDGALWWNTSQKSFVDDDGIPYFNSSGTVNSQWIKYVYLFPNGTNSGARIYSDSSFQAIPPTPAYAFMRSSDYNPIYYNPNITYKPWPSAYINGALRSFSNASASAARSHPAVPLTSSGTTLNLTTTFNSSNSNWNKDNWTFLMLPGMVIPGSSSAASYGCKVNSTSCRSFTSNYTIPNNESWNVAIPYYPATYYAKESCSVNNTSCVRAPDGATLKRYEIKSTDAQMQNFVNWFTYYRKRNLMLNAGMGQVLSQLTNLRGGMTQFNDLEPVTMYDFDSTTSSQNWQALLGAIYLNPTTGGTPTRYALNYIAQQYMSNKTIIQNACQINAGMILTDGFAYNDGPTPPSYASSLYGSGRPYTVTYSGTLADIALSYYTNNLRKDLPSGLVPIELNNTSPSADKNPNLHMNTYAMTLGTKGTIFGVNNAATQNPYSYPPTWPNSYPNASPTAVDDLWHATINGRGLMLNASDPLTVVNAIQQLIDAVIVKSSSGAAIGINPVNLYEGSSTAYASSYTGNYGDLIPMIVDLNTGAVTTDTQGWSARDLLTARASDSRIIATYNGTNGVPFRWVSLTATPSMQALLNSAITPPGPSDGQRVLNWLRGDKTYEGTSYRTRSYLLGDIVYAEPVVIRGALANYADSGYGSFKQAVANRTPMIYQGANDGMLHAFNANTGQEAWAYVPRLNFDQLNKLPSLSYTHRFYVDGTPIVSDVYTGSNWMTLLVGGLRAGGKGYYALDITNPVLSNEATLAAKVKWEFPNAATANPNNIGLSFGKPIIAKTKAAGWVVLVTSGYNNTVGDGKGHLYILNAQNGSIIKDIATTSGSSTSPSGLAQISAFASNKEFDATIDYVYGGDLNGNVWRFDLSGASTGDWNVKLLAQLVDKAGQPQPVTTAPELAYVNNRRIVYVGTGQMLGSSDVYNTQTQSMYALADNASTNPTISSLRSSLVQRTVINNTITGQAVDYTSKRGWVLDFPDAGERVTGDPILAFGTLIFTTNLPSAVACSAKSFLYAVDLLNGTQLTPAYEGQAVPPARQLIGNFLTTRPVIVVLPNGKVVALTHNADNTVLSLELPTDATKVARKIAWKEVLRQ
jgi:type IV pilus assembly protein PilY1